jgi:hypothetical protein
MLASSQSTKLSTKLNAETGRNFTLSEYKKTLGPWDNSISYRAYDREGNNSWEVEWYVTAKGNDEFELRITAHQNKRVVAHVLYYQSNTLKASDLKALNKILPDQIIGGFKGAGEYTQEIKHIKEATDTLSKALGEVTKAVNKAVAAVNKGLKAKDPRKGLVAQLSTLKGIHLSYEANNIATSIQRIQEDIETIAAGK